MFEAVTAKPKQKTEVIALLIGVFSGYHVFRIGVPMARLRRLIPVGVVTLSLLTMPLIAQSARGASGTVENRPDYPSVRLEIQNFEAVVNNTILSAFSGSTLVLTQKTKGVYLQGYGLAFSYIVNIHRAMVTPFGVVHDGEITPDQKRRRIEEIVQKVSKALLENGENLRQVRKEDLITIVGYFEDRNFPDEQNQNKTIVLSVLKKDLDEACRGEDRWKEFKQRMKTVEY